VSCLLPLRPGSVGITRPADQLSNFIGHRSGITDRVRAMLFGELFAATAGLGFMMVTASASYQTHKGLAGFLITVFLLVALSTTLRWIVKRFYSLEKSSIVPLPVT
jgi:ABC-type nitrate/sulfonate/bicarbonate transport system permease component